MRIHFLCYACDQNQPKKQLFLSMFRLLLFASTPKHTHKTNTNRPHKKLLHNTFVENQTTLQDVPLYVRRHTHTYIYNTRIKRKKNKFSVFSSIVSVFKGKKMLKT